MPTCSTCHGSVGGQLLSPRALERQCAECHGPNGIEPRPGRAADARLLLEGIAEVRESRDAARHLIDRVRDPGRRSTLEAAYLQTEVPMIEARNRRLGFPATSPIAATSRVDPGFPSPIPSPKFSAIDRAKRIFPEGIRN